MFLIAHPRLGKKKRYEMYTILKCTWSNYIQYSLQGLSRAYINVLFWDWLYSQATPACFLENTSGMEPPSEARRLNLY